MMWRLRCWIVVSVAASLLQPCLWADPVPVRHVEGTVHGYLALRSQDGRVLAAGDLIETVRGDTVTLHLVFHFKDGSLDDETAEYSQRGHFRLIRDHHVESGPSFPHPMDLLIDVRRGQVTSRSVGKDGKQQVSTKQIGLPPDLANGMILACVKNLLAQTPETRISMLVPTPKPRLVKLLIFPRGEEPFLVGGSKRKAMRFEIKIELGGVAGVVAPLIGKQPPPIEIWIEEGPAPAFVKEEGPFFEGGPIWTIELTNPVWPDSAH